MASLWKGGSKDAVSPRNKGCSQPLLVCALGVSRSLVTCRRRAVLSLQVCRPDRDLTPSWRRDTWDSLIEEREGWTLSRVTLAGQGDKEKYHRV